MLSSARCRRNRPAERVGARVEPNRPRDESLPNVSGVGRQPTERAEQEPEADLEAGDSPHSYWTLPRPDPAPTGRRIGWLVVGIGAGAIALFAAYRASNTIPNPNEPDAVWNDGMILIGSAFAALAAFVTGLLLLGVAARQLVDLPVAGAVRALAVGVVGALVIVVAIVALIASSSPSGGKLPPFLMITVPTLSAIGVTLLAALVRRK